MWNEKIENISVYPIAGLGPSIDSHNIWLVPIEPNALPLEVPLFHQQTWAPVFESALRSFAEDSVSKLWCFQRLPKQSKNQPWKKNRKKNRIPSFSYFFIREIQNLKLMMGLTHIFFACLIYFSLWRIGLVTPDISQLIFLAIGSILPDIDHPQGIIYQFLSTPKWLSKGISGLAQRHRGPTHTLLVAIIFLVASILLVNVCLQYDLMISLMLFLGYMCHLFSDSLTKKGVAWLSPFSRKSLKWIVRTGSKGERYFFVVVTAILLLILAYRL